MKLPIYHPEGLDTFWRVVSFGRQKVAPGRPYWWDNRPRLPAGQCVVQATLAGQIVYRDATGDRLVGPDQLLLFAFAENSAYGLPRPSHDAYVCEWINLDGAGVREHFDALRARHGPTIDLSNHRGLLDEMRHLAEMARPLATTGLTLTDAAHAVHRFVMRLHEHANRHLAQTQTPVQRAIEHLTRTPTHAWSLKRVADQHGISREHLSRVFRQTVGQSPAAYLATARLRHAMHLIRQTDLPLRAVAEQAGFASVHTLARRVREETGRPPGALRHMKRPA